MVVFPGCQFKVSKIDFSMWWYQGRNEGGQGGHNFPGAESLWGGRMTAGPPQSPKDITSTFFNTVHLLTKDL